jgi:hypothetical protein
MMEQTLKETLTALLDDVIKGLARFGCGLAGIPYED